MINELSSAYWNYRLICCSKVVYANQFGLSKISAEQIAKYKQSCYFLLLFFLFAHFFVFLFFLFFNKAITSGHCNFSKEKWKKSNLYFVELMFFFFFSEIKHQKSSQFYSTKHKICQQLFVQWNFLLIQTLSFWSTTIVR